VRLIIEEIEGSIYIDAILNDDEAQFLKDGALLESMSTMKYKRFYVGVRVGDHWRHSENNGFFEDKLLE